MNNSVVVLFSPFTLFTEKSIVPPIKELDIKTNKIIYSTLLIENYLSLISCKRWKVDLIIPNDDFEYLPAIFNTINTKINFFNFDNTEIEIKRILENYTRNDYTKIIFLTNTIYKLDHSSIEFIFDSIPVDTEKAVIGIDKLRRICCIGTNDLRLFDWNFILRNLNQDEILLKHLLQQDIEISLFDEFYLCKNLDDVKSLISYYKNSPLRYKSIYVNQLLNFFFEKHKGVTAS